MAYGGHQQKRTTVFGYLVNIPDGIPSTVPAFAVPPSCVLGNNAGRTRYEQRQIDAICFCRTYFTAAQCPHGATCADLHVDRAFTLAALQGGQPCCRVHGDGFTQRLLEDVPELLVSVHPATVHGITIPVDRMCVTAAVLRHRAHSQVEICAEHAKGFCSRLKDCPKLHVCRQLYMLAVQSAPARSQQPWGIPPARAPTPPALGRAATPPMRTGGTPGSTATPPVAMVVGRAPTPPGAPGLVRVGTATPPATTGSPTAGAGVIGSPGPATAATPPANSAAAAPAPAATADGPVVTGAEPAALAATHVDPA